MLVSTPEYKFQAREHAPIPWDNKCTYDRLIRKMSRSTLCTRSNKRKWICIPLLFPYFFNINKRNAKQHDGRANNPNIASKIGQQTLILHSWSHIFCKAMSSVIHPIKFVKDKFRDQSKEEKEHKTYRNHYCHLLLLLKTP